MRMHQKAMKRHSQHVEHVNRVVFYDPSDKYHPIKIRFNFLDGTSTMLVMGDYEALDLIADIKDSL